MIKAKNTYQLQNKISQLIPVITKYLIENSIAIILTNFGAIQFNNEWSVINLTTDNFWMKIAWHDVTKTLFSTKFRKKFWDVKLLSDKVLKVWCRYLEPFSSYCQYLGGGNIYPQRRSVNSCAFIWWRNYDSNSKTVVFLQKRALRKIDKKPYLYTSNGLLLQHKILKFKDIVRQQNTYYDNERPR